jgi:hypothetical protein
MTITYIQAISIGFPDVGCHSSGDASVYENIIWDSGNLLPSKEVIDAWIASNSGVRLNQIEITKYEFRKLFTFSERIAIDSAPDNTNISSENRAILYTMFKDLDLSGMVQMYNPDVISGVNFLEQIGLLSSGRAAQILSIIKPL